MGISSGFASLDDVQTLTNKTLTSPVLTTPQINDTSADHQYVFAVSELAADRTITLPLLTGNDEFVFKDFTQTLTNKTLTSPALTSPVLTTPQINDTSADHQYIFAVSELTADRTVTLPLLTGNDTFVFKDFAQTLTNKTLTSPALNTPTITSGEVATGLDMNATELKLDSDGDTSITADTEDTIDIKINNADDFQFTANTFSALTGSVIKTNTLQATGTEHITLTPGTDKVIKMAVARQDSTTNTYPASTIIQTGWGWILGEGDETCNEAVTFPMAFSSVPIVIISDCGDLSGSNPATIDDLNTTGAAIKSCQDITVNGFNAYIYARDDDLTLSNTVRYGYSWIAIGPIA